MEKQISENENERLTNRSLIEQLQNQMSEMQENDQKTRDEHERIIKQLKQENELLNQQIKQHLTDQSSTNLNNQKSFVYLSSVFFEKIVLLRSTSNAPLKSPNESSQPEIFLFKYLNAWRDAFTELTIYIEERLKNNHRSPENNDKVFS